MPTSLNLSRYARGTMGGSSVLLVIVSTSTNQFIRLTCSRISRPSCMQPWLGMRMSYIRIPVMVWGRAGGYPLVGGDVAQQRLDAAHGPLDHVRHRLRFDKNRQLDIQL